MAEKFDENRSIVAYDQECSSACIEIFICITVQQLSKFVQIVQKRLAVNKFASTNSHMGSTFSKTIVEQLDM